MAHPLLSNHRFRIAIASTFVLLSLLYISYWNGHTPLSISKSISSAAGKLRPVPEDTNEDIAICIATRDNPLDLPEFLIHHYHHHGIRRFYIMDDRSDPPLSTFTDYGIPRQHISFQYFDEKNQQKGMQDHIYSECRRLFGPLHKWMAMIDADEFIEVRAPDTLHSILKELEVEGVGALGINWRLHTSNGLLKKPESARKAFTSCAIDEPGPQPEKGWKDNRAIKSIVRTEMWIEPPYSPHQFRVVNGSKTVGEHGDIIEDDSNVRIPITRDRIGLHHYTTKSREQFEAKMKTWTAKGWSYWDHIEGLEQVECLEMAKYDP